MRVWNACFKSTYQTRVSELRKARFICKRDFETRVWIIYLKRASETRVSKKKQTHVSNSRFKSAFPEAVIVQAPRKCDFVKSGKSQVRYNRVWKSIRIAFSAPWRVWNAILKTTTKISKCDKRALDKKIAVTENGIARFALFARLKRDKRDKCATKARFKRDKRDFESSKLSFILAKCNSTVLQYIHLNIIIYLGKSKFYLDF